MKLNCWEAMDCGRHKGGKKVDELGVCPASLEKRLDGVNGGVNGGRSCCWKKTLSHLFARSIRRDRRLTSSQGGH